MRRILADVENNARDLRDRQGLLESQLLSVPAASWPEAAAKARYILTSYAAGLAPTDTRHRDLIDAVLADFDRLYYRLDEDFDLDPTYILFGVPVRQLSVEDQRRLRRLGRAVGSGG